MKFYKKMVVIALVGMALLTNGKTPAYAATILGKDVTSYIASRSDTVSVGVYDANSGQTYTYNPSQTYRTESVVKMSMLADVLDQNIAITNNENSLLTRMIENSDNSAASTIWQQLGSDRKVQSFFQLAGLNNTVAGTGGWWGYTTTNVLDQLTMMKYFAYHNSLLTDAQRAYGLNLMQNVEPDQRWGTGYGIPSGVRVALKNGWVTTTPATVNSVGYINGENKSYVITVLTKNNKSLSEGIDTINTISSLVWNEFSGNNWVLSNGRWYFYTDKGKTVGWLDNNGKWYYFDTAGAMKTGWLKYGGVSYYLNNDGSMKRGWLYNGGAWYFFDNSGAMKTGWIQTGGKWYYLNSTGEMKTGWLPYGGKRYFLKPNGEMCTGRFSINGKWYNFDQTGAMVTG